MRKQKTYIKATDHHRQLKKQESTLDSTFDFSHRGFRKVTEAGRRAAVKITLRVPQLGDKKKQSLEQQIEDQKQLDTDEQLLQIFKMSAQVEKRKPFNDINKAEKPKIEKDEHTILFQRLHKLFDFYIKQEILKHYCLKSGWKIQKKFLDKLVLPTFDLLAISKDKIGTMFEPFLKQLTSKYILQTELDTYFRMTPECLLMQITEVWIRIKQAEIQVKRSIRGLLSYWKLNFCKRSDGKLLLERSALYNSMFANSKQIRMVSLIKIFIFCFKSQGQNNQQSFQDWLQQY